MERDLDTERIASMSMTNQASILTLGRTEFLVHIGDISRSDADVLVNSSGTGSEKGLTPGTVSAAVRQAGGDLIFDELRAHEPLVPGDVIVTGAGKLNARYVFHAVIVGWSDEQRVLQATIWRAVSKSIALAQLMGLASIALPALGTGSGGANRWETHSSIAAACLETFRTDSALRRILFCFLTLDESADFRRAFYQQQLVRELRGLSGGGGEQGQLSAALGNLYKRLLEPASDIDEIKRVVEQTLQSSPRAAELYIISNYGSGSIAVGDGAQAVGPSGVIIGGGNSGAINTRSD